MPYIKEVCVAGDTIEVSKYYSVRWHTTGEKRAKKEKPSSEAMKKINQRLASRNLRRLLNTNFHDGDFLVRLDFSKEIPKDSQEMQELLAKGIRKMKAEYKKAGMEMKYVYVKEVGPKGGRHVHMVMNKCDTDILRKCWRYGGIHVDPLNSFGQYAKIADYFIKYAVRTEETEGELVGKRYYASRNLKKPLITKKVIKAERFRTEIRPKKGFYLDKDSIRHGISDLTGYEFLAYTFIRGGEGG